MPTMWWAQTTCSSDETGTDVVEGGAAEAEDGAAEDWAADGETMAEVTTAELVAMAETVALELEDGDELALVFVTIKTGLVSEGTGEPVTVVLSQLDETNSYSSKAQSPPHVSVLSPAQGMEHDPSL